MTAHDAPSFESLIAQLQDKSSAVRVDAAKQLGELRDPRAIEPLAALLKHFDKNSQIAAAHALGEINDPRAIESLSEALKHTYFETFDAVKAALEKLGAGDVANKVSTERQQTNALQENKEGGRSLLLWGVGLLAIGLLCSLGSYGMASVQASQQAAMKGFGSASYLVFSGPILIGGILLAIGFFRSQGAVHVGKIVASIAVGFFAFFDVVGIFLAVNTSVNIPDAVGIPLVLGMLVGALLLAIRLAVRSWRDIIIAAGLTLLLFCLVSSVFTRT
jgi:hypothetical protein